MSGFSAGDSSVFPSSALDFLPDFSASSKSSSAVPVKGHSSTSLVRPLFPAFCFLRDAGALALALTADSEVDDAAGVDGGVLDS